VTLKEGVWIDIPRFFKQVSDAGYGPRREDVRLTLTGKITEEGNRLLLTVDDVKPGPQVFLLAQGKSKDAKEKGQMEKAFKDARSLVGEVVEMEGVWKPPVNKSEKDTPATLFLRRAIKAPERRRGES
jgi:hypothetical protein